MPVQKQLVPLSLQTGLNQKADDFVSTGTADLINGQFVDKTSIAARAGVGPVVSSPAAYAGDTMDALGLGKRLTAVGDQLLVESMTGLHALDVVNNKTRQIAAAFNRCNVEAEQIFYATKHAIAYDLAVVGSTTVIVYQAVELTASPLTQSQIFVKVIVDGVVLQDRRVDTSTAVAWCPRVVVCGTKVYAYWIEQDGGSNSCVTCGAFDSASPGTPATVTRLTTDVQKSIDGQLDACPAAADGGAAHDVFLAYFTTGAGTIKTLRLSGTDGTTIIESAASATTAFNTQIRVFTVGAVSGGKLGYVVSSQTSGTYASGIQLWIADLDTTGAHTVTACNTTTGASLGKVSGYSPAAATLCLLFEDDGVTGGAAPGKSTCAVKSQIVTFSNFSGGIVHSGTAVLARGVGIGADPFKYGLSFYLPVIHYSELQAHYSVIEVGRLATDQVTRTDVSTWSGRDVCARIDMNGTFMFDATYTVGGSTYLSRWSARVIVPHTFVGVDGNQAQLLVNRGNGSRSLENSVDTTPLGLDLITLDFSAQLGNAVLQDLGVLAGGTPALFDGSQLTELGFDQFPEYFTAVQGSGGGLADADYGLSLVYSWYDARGKLHRSAPSPAKSVTVSGKSGGGLITIVAPTLRATRKLNVTIDVYLTEAAGVVYYRALLIVNSVLTSNAPNDPNADTVTIKVFSVASIAASDLLYTTGGVLPNLPYPACKGVALHQERLVFTGLLDQDRIQFTHAKNSDDGLFPGTHDTLDLAVEASKGRVCAAVSMDDKLMVLQENAIGGFIGTGPNTLGLASQFSDFNLFLSGYGQRWDQSNAVARDPAGFWFKDKRGLRHLGRGLTLDQEQIGDKTFPLGAAVDALAAAPIQGACFHEDNKQTVFAIPGEPALLVFDHEHRQWAQWKIGFNPDCADPVVFAGSLTFLAQTACAAYKLDSGLKTDSADGSALTDVTIQYETPWIKLTDLQGFQRVMRLLLLVQAGGAAPPGVFQGTFDSGTGAFADQVINATASAGQVQVGDLLISPIVTPRGAWTVTAVSGAPGAYTITATVNPLFDTLGVAFGTSVTNQGNDITLYCFRPNTVTITIAEYTNYTKLANSFTVGPSSFTATDMTQIEHQITNQKCESIKFVITVDPVNAGSPFRLSGLSLLVGVKPGSKFKVPSGNRL